MVFKGFSIFFYFFSPIELFTGFCLHCYLWFYIWRMLFSWVYLMKALICIFSWRFYFWRKGSNDFIHFLLYEDFIFVFNNSIDRHSSYFTKEYPSKCCNNILERNNKISYTNQVTNKNKTFLQLLIFSPREWLSLNLKYNLV